MTELADRYAWVRSRIEERARSANRSPDEITLVVVSKNNDAQLVRDLHALGQRHFAENRDQEAAPKAAATADLDGIVWHFVGQLQSNKVRSVLSYSSTIHSIDRPSLLEAIAKCSQFAPVQGFIQLNLTDNPNRGGIVPSDLLKFAEQALRVPNLEILGVMGVAALERDPRIDFEAIAQASQTLRGLVDTARFISAGMSHDFEDAIDFGATHLRIGSAITSNQNL